MESTPTVTRAVNCTHVQKPCKDCPFSREVKPGALGGSPVNTYIGQAYGPFVIPCHKHCDFTDPDWKQKTIDTPQCAGVAIFRANIGVSPYLPAMIHTLAPNHDAVFSSPAEFMAHHMALPLEYAQHILKTLTPSELLKQQLARQSNLSFTK